MGYKTLEIHVLPGEEASQDSLIFRTMCLEEYLCIIVTLQ